ncbi:MAG: dTMP kinase, partial [Cryomorphaceae bacterium]
MSDNARGSFITIEGQDGAGKSTNVEVVQAYLQQHDIDFVHTREPGGTTFGEQVRDLLLGSGDDSLGEMAELLLVFAARAEHIKQVIEPALSQGKWVLCDRFTDATYAYQGGGRGMSMSEIAKLEQSIQGSLRPDL